MNVPTHLQHQPVIAVNDYHTRDGHYKPHETDVRALSIGHAQYDPDGIDFSAKIFRHTGKLPSTGSNIPPDGKWSRQSEELPLHRVLDLAILIASVMKRQTADESNLSGLSEEVISTSGFSDLKKYLADNADHIQPRLSKLKSLL